MLTVIKKNDMTVKSRASWHEPSILVIPIHYLLLILTSGYLSEIQEGSYEKKTILHDLGVRDVRQLALFCKIYLPAQVL